MQCIRYSNQHKYNGTKNRIAIIAFIFLCAVLSLNDWYSWAYIKFLLLFCYFFSFLNFCCAIATIVCARNHMYRLRDISKNEWMKRNEKRYNGISHPKMEIIVVVGIPTSFNFSCLVFGSFSLLLLLLLLLILLFLKIKKKHFYNKNLVSVTIHCSTCSHRLRFCFLFFFGFG